MWGTEDVASTSRLKTETDATVFYRFRAIDSAIALIETILFAPNALADLLPPA
jgi:hypothetical protein